MEGFNRAMFSFNEGLDDALLKPTVKVYTTILPDVVRTGISNFFSNVGDIWVGVNNLLQGKPDQAVSDIGRVLVNSTIGILGLFDVASDMGMQHHNEDFGQTLGRWGVNSGAYLVLPVFGPRTVRDGFGLAADLYANPVGHINDIPARNSTELLQFVDVRANLDDSQKILEQAALDRYTFVRESYLQRRRNLIYDGDPPPLPKTDDDAAAGSPQRLAALPGEEPAAARAAQRSAEPSAASSTGTPPAPQARAVAYPIAVPAIPDRVARDTDNAAPAKP